MQLVNAMKSYKPEFGNLNSHTLRHYVGMMALAFKKAQAQKPAKPNNSKPTRFEVNMQLIAWAIDVRLFTVIVILLLSSLI